MGVCERWWLRGLINDPSNKSHISCQSERLTNYNARIPFQHTVQLSASPHGTIFCPENVPPGPADTQSELLGGGLTRDRFSRHRTLINPRSTWRYPLKPHQAVRMYLLPVSLPSSGCESLNTNQEWVWSSLSLLETSADARQPLRSRVSGLPNTVQRWSGVFRVVFMNHSFAVI